jgi:hypothetical protein
MNIVVINCVRVTTLGRVHETIVAMGKQYICVRVRVGWCAGAFACTRVVLPRMPSACAVHVVICGLWLHQIFRYYLRNGMALGKKVIEHKMCFDFPATFIENVSHYKKNSARCFHKCENVFM